MSRLKKYCRVHLVMGFVLSIASIIYGFWSFRVFRGASYGTLSLDELKEAPFFHPWTVWNRVADIYVEKTGNWDPAASGHLLSTCMLTMIYAGIGLLMICSIVLVVKIVRNSGIQTQNSMDEHARSGEAE